MPRDAAQALVWCRRAAEQGQVEAMYMIGAQCAAGRGVRQDYVQAHVWLSLAAAEGNAVAAKSSKDVAQRMSEEDIAKAQRLALAHRQAWVWRGQGRLTADRAVRAWHGSQRRCLSR